MWSKNFLTHCFHDFMLICKSRDVIRESWVNQVTKNIDKIKTCISTVAMIIFPLQLIIVGSKHSLAAHKLLWPNFGSSLIHHDFAKLFII